MKRWLRVALTGLLLMALAGCSSESSGQDAEQPEPASQEAEQFELRSGCATRRFGTQIRRAERRWENAGIASYQIEVAVTRSTFHHQRHQMEVSDGVVVSASATCVTAPMETALGKECEVEAFDPADYTVPALFDVARSLAAKSGDGVTLCFDEAYGYPSSMADFPTDIVDGERAWRVTSFEVLP